MYTLPSSQQEMAEALPSMIWTATPDGVVDYVNDLFETYTGQGRNQAGTINWLSAVHPDDKERSTRVWAESVANGSPYQTEFRILHKPSGVYRWHHVAARPHHNDSGKITRWYGITTDIHDSKPGQADQERLTAIAHASGDIFWEYQPATNSMWHSDGMLRLFGRDPATDILLNQGLLCTDYVHEDDRDRIISEMALATTHRHGWSLEYRFLHANGSYAHVLNRATVIRNTQGHAARIVGTITDVSQQKALQEQLRYAQRLEAVSHLTGGLAHDFNNLLTIILGNAGQLLDELPQDSEHHEMAKMMKLAGRKGADLIRSLLAFSRQQELQSRPVRINDVIQGMRSLLHRALGTHLTLNINLEPAAWTTQTDPSQLESSLLNLIANAGDAMGSSGTLTVRTANAPANSPAVSSNARHGDFVMIEIRDTGCGIDPALLPRIFDPFFTTKPFGKGSGLGLSMVYGFVQQSGGFIDVDSVPGRGTCFRLYFPKDAQGQEPADTETTTAPLVAGHGLVLVVEDDPMVRRLLIKQLPRLGYTVLAANDGSAGLAMLRARPDIDLLLTDMMMPGGLDGYQLAELARQENPAIRVILSSGYSDKLSGTKNRTPEGYWLLTKPYIRAQLAAALGKAFSMPAC